MNTGTQSRCKTKVDGSNVRFNAIAENWNIYVFANDISLKVRTELREVKVERKDVENVVLSVRKAISCKSSYGGDAVALSIFDDCQRSESGPMIKPIAKMEKWNLYKAPSIDALIRVMFRASSFVFDPADLAHGVGPSVSIRGKVKAALTWFNKKKSRPCVLTVDNC